MSSLSLVTIWACLAIAMVTTVASTMSAMPDRPRSHPTARTVDSWAERASGSAGGDETLAGGLQLGPGQRGVLSLPFGHRDQPLANLESQPRGIGHPDRHADTPAGRRSQDLFADVGADRDRQRR